MRILITNDDGIAAPGIAALWRAVRDLGEVTVVAPDSERSAVGHAITLAEPLRVGDYDRPGRPHRLRRLRDPGRLRQDRRPRDPRPPPGPRALGDQPGGELGTNVLYSGTVSAATEAAMLGVPAAAFSLADRHWADFTAAAACARRLAPEIARHGLPHGVSLNVNVPPLPAAQIRGTVLTRQGRVRMLEWFDRRNDPRDRHYYWMVGERLEDDAEPGSGFDDAAVSAGSSR